MISAQKTVTRAPSSFTVYGVVNDREEINVDLQTRTCLT